MPDSLILGWPQAFVIIATLIVGKAYELITKRQAAAQKTEEDKAAAKLLALEVQAAAVKVENQVNAKAAEAQQMAGAIKQTVDATKVLVNSRHGKSLAVSVRLARRLVGVSDTPENREELARALAEQEEHEIQQDILDNQP